MSLEETVAELTKRLANAEAELGQLRNGQVRSPRGFLRRRLPVVLALGVAGLGLAYLGVAAALPAPPEPVFTYRGVLEQDGDPVTNPEVEMTFRLYRSASGADEIAGWAQTHSVAVSNGQFNVNLTMKEDCAEEEPAACDYSTSEGLFLSVEVDGQPLSGRQQLTGVPYALHAAEAEKLTGGPWLSPELSAASGQEESVSSGSAFHLCGLNKSYASVTTADGTAQGCWVVAESDGTWTLRAKAAPNGAALCQMACF